jgi:hypothetical protein
MCLTAMHAGIVTQPPLVPNVAELNETRSHDSIDREQSIGRKERLPITHQETKYALPTQRKIPIGRDRPVNQI